MLRFSSEEESKLPILLAGPCCVGDLFYGFRLTLVVSCIDVKLSNMCARDLIRLKEDTEIKTSR